MKQKEGFVLYNIANENVIMPLGSVTAELNGMIRLNETGTLLWNALAQDTTEDALAELLVSKYSVSKEQALSDVREFTDGMKKVGCIE